MLRCNWLLLFFALVAVPATGTSFCVDLLKNETTIPKDIFVKKGTTLFRGISMSMTDSQIAQLFHSEYGILSVRAIQTEEKERLARQSLANLKELSTTDLARIVASHGSGIVQDQSLFLSATFDIGVAAYFSFLGNGQRHLILQFKAPQNTINVTAVSKTHPPVYIRTGEAEAMVPIKISAEDIEQILEVTEGGALVGRWVLQTDGKISHQVMTNLTLPINFRSLLKAD